MRLPIQDYFLFAWLFLIGAIIVAALWLTNGELRVR